MRYLSKCDPLVWGRVSFAVLILYIEEIYFSSYFHVFFWRKVVGGGLNCTPAPSYFKEFAFNIKFLGPQHQGKKESRPASKPGKEELQKRALAYKQSKSP